MIDVTKTVVYIVIAKRYKLMFHMNPKEKVSDRKSEVERSDSKGQRPNIRSTFFANH